MDKNRQLQILEYLIKQDTLKKQKEIADKFQISRERVRQILNILEKKGYIRLLQGGKYELLLVDKKQFNKNKLKTQYGNCEGIASRH